MPFNYDFSKIPDSQYDLLDPGWYPFRITEAEETESKKGDPMVKVVATCLDPANKGKEVWHWVVFLPEDAKGSGISKHFVKSIGLPVDTKTMVDPSDWEGRTFMAKVSVEEYNGKRNNKFAEIGPINKDEPVAQEEDPFDK